MRAGAPWAYSNEIVMDAASKALSPGTLVKLARDDGAALGVGYFNPKSLIAVRLLSADANAEIGREFFSTKFKQALSLREAFFDKPYYRLVHAEGDGLPGLVIDRFGDTLVVADHHRRHGESDRADARGAERRDRAGRNHPAQRCAVARARRLG